MRHKDDKKYDAICDAAIGLINSEGFAQTSMSKIARKANVAPATIYIYFKNKEDLINQLYLKIKQEMSVEILKALDERLSIEKQLKQMLLNFYRYFSEYQEYFAFKEQFSNSPLIDSISQNEAYSYYQPIEKLFAQAREEGIISDISNEFIFALTLAPIIHLMQHHYKGELNLTEIDINEVIELTWKAITP